MPNLRTHAKMADGRLFSLWQCRQTKNLFRHGKRQPKDCPIPRAVQRAAVAYGLFAAAIEWRGLDPSKSGATHLRALRAWHEGSQPA